MKIYLITLSSDRLNSNNEKNYTCSFYIQSMTIIHEICSNVLFKETVAFEI